MEEVENNEKVVIDKKNTQGFQASPENHCLLFHPYDIKSIEKRHIQSIIFAECILDIKKQFNTIFMEVSRNKQDEISKIEEKNERISAILVQLDKQEDIYHPELDSDEVPESNITVKDDEVKIEKFRNAEERNKDENKRRVEEERFRIQSEDNARVRALMTMMNGKLDDKKEQVETVEIQRPEWMNKPKEEMTEDEKKAVKEFEKKLAIYKVL
jgi:hypothetical protein